MVPCVTCELLHHVWCTPACTGTTCVSVSVYFMRLFVPVCVVYPSPPPTPPYPYVCMRARVRVCIRAEILKEKKEVFLGTGLSPVTDAHVCVCLVQYVVAEGRAL